MNKYSVFSLSTLVIFIIMFFTMLSGVSFGAIGKPYIVAMFLFPLIGIVLGFKANKGLIQWLLISLNILAIFVILYISLIAYGIAES